MGPYNIIHCADTAHYPSLHWMDRLGPSVWLTQFKCLYSGKLKQKIMYSLNCSYYTAEFKTLGDLIAHILISGMDPNYEITYNGKPTGEMAVDLIGF